MPRPRRPRIAAVTIACVALLACGGSSSSSSGPPLPDPGPSSGIDRNAELVKLTPTQLAALCDWVAGRLGGWGRSETCSDGSVVSAPPSEAACESELGSAVASICTATVGMMEDCVDQSLPSCRTVPGVCFEVLIPCATVM